MPLEKLQDKQRQFEIAIDSVRQTSQSLGTEGRVERLNRFNAEISSFEKILRIRKIGEIRSVIQERTIPTLEGHLQSVTEAIQKHPQTRVHTEILAIRQLLDQGLLTEEEGRQAEQEAGNILGTIEFQPAELQRIQALQDTMNSFQLTDTERRILEAGVGFSEQSPGSNEEWIRAIDNRRVITDQVTKKFYENKRRALNKVSSKIELVTLWPEGQGRGRKSAYYLKVKEVLPPTPPEEEAKPELLISPVDYERVKRHKESRQIFDITIDGRQIKVMGRLTMLSLQALESTSAENRIRLADLANNLYDKDDQESISKAKDLMRMNNERGFAKLDLQVVIEGIKDQVTVYLERLTKEGKQLDQTAVNIVNIEKLQQELEELYQLRTEIQEQVTQGIWTQNDMYELNAQITQKEAEIRLLKPLEPEDIEEDLEHGPAVETPPDLEVESPEVRFIPYKPSPEEIRSDRETKILDYITTTLITSGRIRYEDLQAAIFSGERAKRMGGEDIYAADLEDTKAVFREALRKMREEADVLNERASWDEKDRLLWERLEVIIQRLSDGDTEDFRRRVLREIERAAREFSPDSKIIWIKLNRRQSI